MKKFVLFLMAIVLIAGCNDSILENELSLKKAEKNVKVECTSIQDGIFYSASHYLADQTIPTGFDVYGYNYQAHMYKGSYANAYLGGDGFPPYEGDDEAYLAANPTVDDTYIDNNGEEQYVQWYWPYRMYEIEMKWNDAWLSNKDCDLDGGLDRHYGSDSYIGSGAWEMYSEKMGGKDGYTYMCKIIAVPADAVNVDNIWYNSDGVEIGPVIWGSFAIIQEVQGGSGVDDHGLLYKGDDHTGLGGW